MLLFIPTQSQVDISILHFNNLFSQTAGMCVATWLHYDIRCCLDLYLYFQHNTMQIWCKQDGCWSLFMIYNAYVIVWCFLFYVCDCSISDNFVILRNKCIQTLVQKVKICMKWCKRIQYIFLLVSNTKKAINGRWEPNKLYFTKSVFKNKETNIFSQVTRLWSKFR